MPGLAECRQKSLLRSPSFYTDFCYYQLLPVLFFPNKAIKEPDCDLKGQSNNNNKIKELIFLLKSCHNSSYPVAQTLLANQIIRVLWVFVSLSSTYKHEPEHFPEHLMVERKEEEESSQGADAITLATRESNTWTRVSDLYHKNVNDHQHDGPALWWGPPTPSWYASFHWKPGKLEVAMSQRTGLISRSYDRASAPAFSSLPTMQP